MLDPEDELFDRKLANHLVSLYYKSSEQEEQEMLVSRLSLEQGRRSHRIIGGDIKEDWGMEVPQRGPRAEPW